MHVRNYEVIGQHLGRMTNRSQKFTAKWTIGGVKMTRDFTDITEASSFQTEMAKKDIWVSVM